MRIVLGDAQIFADAIAAVSKLVDEVTIKTTQTGLEVTALDPANVALVNLVMAASTFKEYSTTDENFSIKLSNFKQILARRDKDATVTLALDNNQLKININGKIVKNFTMPLIELDAKETKVPDLKFNVEITLDNSELREAIADVEIVSESTEFKVSNGKFIVSAAGDTGKAVSETKGVVKVLGETSDALSKYSIEYLNNMLGVKFKNVKLYLGKVYPMKLQYTSDDKLTTIIYVLAPRIDND